MTEAGTSLESAAVMEILQRALAGQPLAEADAIRLIDHAVGNQLDSAHSHVGGLEHERAGDLPLNSEAVLHRVRVLNIGIEDGEHGSIRSLTSLGRPVRNLSGHRCDTILVSDGLPPG